MSRWDTAEADGAGKNSAEVLLRPFREQDLDLLTRFATDPEFSAPFEWAGYRSPDVFRQRWERDGFLDEDPRYLAVVDQKEEALRWVMWEHPYRGIGGDGVWVIGILLAPECRGRGIGTTAQRLLVGHLFGTTTVHRLCAFTEASNLAEQ